MHEEIEIKKQSILHVVNDLAYLLNNINGDVLFELESESDLELESDSNSIDLKLRIKPISMVLLHSTVLMARSKWF
jgi:hypothetical protein